MSMTRCKFRCASVTKFPEHDGFSFETTFHAVTGGSPENDEFFKYTPGGEMKLAVHTKDIFVPGKEYYLDITPAE